MRIVLFGATGMIGQGVLRACLLDPEVSAVLSIVRRASDPAPSDPKLRELVHAEFTQFASIADQLTGYDACLFCLGVSSLGMAEDAYRAVTYDIALAAATVLAAHNPTMTFEYISGAGTDRSERGRTMWARVKGATENALLALPFARAYMVRPAYVQPLHGARARTRWTRVLYLLIGFAYPLWRWLAPKYVTTTDELARAMLAAAKHGAPDPVIENRALAALAHRG